MLEGSAKPRGFTLIELMITIVIMAFLLMLGMPFTRDWIDGVRQMQARNVLLEGMGQARALALRNPSQKTAGQPVAVMRVADGEVWVGFSGAANATWKANLSSLNGTVALKTTGKADFASTAAFTASTDGFSCVAFNSRGVRLPGAAGCGLPLTQERIAVGVGNKEPMYVELL